MTRDSADEPGRGPGLGRSVPNPGRESRRRLGTDSEPGLVTVTTVVCRGTVTPVAPGTPAAVT